MADKDHEQLLVALEPHLAHVVCTQNSTDRGRCRRSSWPRSRVRSSARTGSRSRRGLGDAIEAAATLAEAGAAFGEGLGSGAVLVTGSVVTVGEARTLLVRPAKGERR